MTGDPIPGVPWSDAIGYFNPWFREARVFCFPVDAVIDMRPGGIIRVRKSTDCTWIEPDRAREVPNRLHGAAINAEGDAI